MSKKQIALVTLLVVGLVVGSVAGYIAIGKVTYSEGDRVGTIVKFTRKGFPRTWEGELLSGSAQPGQGMVWEFSVDGNDTGVIEKINEATDHGGKVKIHYRQQLWKQSWRGKTSYFVVDVKEIKS